jgi:uncharacterized protein YlxW (UPF0749 family)
MQGYYKHPAPPRVQVHVAPWVKWTLAIACIILITLFVLAFYTLHNQHKKITQLENERDTLLRRNQTLDISINNISAEHTRLLNQIKTLEAQSAHTAQLQNRITELENIIESFHNSQSKSQESHAARSPSTTPLTP